MSISLFRLLSLASTTLRYLNVSTCCSVFQLTCRIHCLGRLKRHNTAIFLVLILVPALSHAAENRSNAYWRPFWEEIHACSTNSSAKSKANGSSCSSQQWHPRRRVCDCPLIHVDHTHESAKPSGVLSSPNSLSNFSQVVSSSDLAAASEFIDAQYYGSFHLRKAKTSYLKNFTQFCQVRWQRWRKERSPCWFFCFQKSQWNNARCIILYSDSCFSASQIPQISLLSLLPHSTTTLFSNARCNCRPFFFIVVWRKASRLQRWNSKALKCNFVHHTVQICGRKVAGRSEVVRMTMHRYTILKIFAYNLCARKYVSACNTAVVCCNNHVQENMLSSNRFTSR